MSYQGWKNYETWAVALWLDNELATYEQFSERARAIADCAMHALPSFGMLYEHYTREPDGAENVKQGRVSMLADELKAWADDEAPELGASMWTDLLGAALDSVDWREIATHYLGNVAEYAQ